MARCLEKGSSGSDTTQASCPEHNSARPVYSDPAQRLTSPQMDGTKASGFWPALPIELVRSGPHCPKPANEEQRQATVTCLGLSQKPRNVDPMLKSVVELLSSVMKTAVAGTPSCLLPAANAERCP